MVVDNSVDAVCVLLGLWLAGLDTLLIERDNSYLDDTGSIVWSSGISAVVAPLGTAVPSGRKLVAYPELLAASRRQPGAAADGHEPEVLQVTSGSTGEPRATVHPLANVLDGGVLYRDLQAIASTDVIVVPLPLAHSFGLIGGLMAGIAAGAEVVTMPQLMLRRLSEALTAPGAIVLGTPLLYRLVTASAPGLGPGGGRENVKAALCSGGPLAPDVASAASQWLGNAPLQVYGSTETGLISCELAADTARPPGSVGRPAPGVTLRAPSAGGEESELSVRTSTMLTGYFGAKPLRPGGFWETGDVGYIAADGHLYLTGRKETFINVGGRKVNPARIERLLTQTGLVREVSVYGVDGGEGSEEIHVALVLSPDATLASVRDASGTLLSRYERPAAFHLLDQLPRGPLGKVLRARLPQ